jgi:hypothetical protein
VGAVNAGVAIICDVFGIVDSLCSRDNSSLAFALVVLVVLGTSLLRGGEMAVVDVVVNTSSLALTSCGDDEELDAMRSATEVEFKPPADLLGDLSDTTLGFSIGFERISSSLARSLPFADPT